MAPCVRRDDVESVASLKLDVILQYSTSRRALTFAELALQIHSS
jgi:hypothetical protein